MNCASWLERTARRCPDRAAFFDGVQPVCDYSGFAARAAAFAGSLRERGVGEGARVALFMRNVPDYLVAMWGAWYAGAAVVPVNARLHPREAAWIVGNAGASLVIVTQEHADLAGLCDMPVIVAGGEDWQAALAADPVSAPADLQPGALAWLFYTSGTTGRPKGVEITHRMLMTVSLCYGTDCDTIGADDHTIYAAALSHGAGLYNLVHVLAGAGHVFPRSGGFDPAEVLDLAQALGRAHLFLAPTMVQRLTRVARDAGRRGEGLRTIVYAGGPMYNADIIEAVDWFGPVFLQIYGQGECPMGITVLPRADVADRGHPDWQARLGSVGYAQSSVEVRVGDAEGRALPVGEIGEVMVRGDAVMPGYWNNPEATAKTLRDGWLMTGDLGALDSAGYLTLKDRSKDLIISGGANIYPREVEEVLQAHPDVAEVSVVGRPHDEWGEEVVAFVVPRDGVALDPEALDAHCLAHMARFKRPKLYLALDALPKNNYGKVLKTDLRARLAEPGEVPV